MAAAIVIYFDTSSFFLLPLIDGGVCDVGAGEADSSGVPPVTTPPFGELTTRPPADDAKPCAPEVQTGRRKSSSRRMLRILSRLRRSCQYVRNDNCDSEASAAAATWILAPCDSIPPSGPRVASLRRAGSSHPPGESRRVGPGSLTVPGPQQPCGDHNVPAAPGRPGGQELVEGGTSSSASNLTAVLTATSLALRDHHQAPANDASLAAVVNGRLRTPVL